jgi:hypothetical protein
MTEHDQSVFIGEFGTLSNVQRVDVLRRRAGFGRHERQPGAERVNARYSRNARTAGMRGTTNASSRAMTTKVTPTSLREAGAGPGEAADQGGPVP